MRIAFIHDGKSHTARPPFTGADHVTITACPGPGCKESPAKVSGAGISHHDHDTYYAPARTLCCCGARGELRTTVSTIFGIEEDEAVLGGRPRVY